MPRVDKKRKLVCVYCPPITMFQVLAVTNKGKVSKGIAPQWAFTTDVREAFRKFTVPFAKFRAVPGVDKGMCKTWNEYAEAVWAAAN